MDLSNENVIHVKKDGQEYLQFRKLEKYSDIVKHGYSLGIKKNYRTSKKNNIALSKKEFDENLKNYTEFCNLIYPNNLGAIKAKQNHTDKIIKIENVPEKGKINTEENVDGLITNKKGIILATTNADCILLLFFDPVKKVIANTHSGWKGTLQEISVKTVEKMEEEYGSNPKDIIICICPSIRKCHFEVDSDVYEMFYNQFKKLDNINKFIEKDNQKWHIDTVGINKEILMKKGVLEENIIDSKICSVCNKEIIHSFRAEGENYGLATCLISLK